ncbi:MAG: PA2169 family four-helix-bundle protein [Kiloniellales bacterium]|nr:PA2169 family four-helix-bundle protein [Kiloniellales bacterium]
MNQVIALCRDGLALYELAARRIEDPAISDLFLNMAKLRREAIGELSQLVKGSGEEVRKSGTLAGSTHAFLTEIQAKLSNDETASLVAQLEEHENRTIEQIQDVVRNTDFSNPDAKQVMDVLFDKLEMFKSTRAQITALRESL